MTKDGWISAAEVATANTERDRGQTATLLATLCDERIGDEHRAEVAHALAAIDDPRAQGRLLAIIDDVRLSAAIRLAAADALFDALCAPAADVERYWARRDDAVFEQIALTRATRANEHPLRAVLDDPQHPRYADAIETLSFGFDHPRFVRYAVAALSHADPRVRSAAIKAVLYTEPVAAIAPLLALLDDREPSIAAEALEMLAWYDQSRTVLLGVAAFHARTSDPRAGEIVECIADVLAAVRAGRAAEERASLDAWLAPVRAHVAAALESAAAEEDEAEGLGRPMDDAMQPAWCASVEAFCAHFAPIDKPFRVLDAELGACEWSSVDTELRPALGDALLAWPDAALRQHAARALAAWRDAERLVELLDDPSPYVASMAAYQARHLGKDPQLAARLRQRVEHERLRGRALVETFESYVAVAAPDEWHALSRAILADPEVGEELRVAVAYALREPSAIDVARDHMKLLSAPPAIGWQLHVALLEAARAHGLGTPDLAWLRDADHFGLQCALAAYLASR